MTRVRSGRTKLLLLGGLVLACTAPGLRASEAEPAHAATEEVHAHPKNGIGLFLGVTDGGEAEGGGVEDATSTVGLAYLRHVSPRWGVGVLADWAGGDRRELVVAIPAVLKLGRTLFLFAPGWERKGEHHEDAALFRVGFVYEFEVGRTKLGPTFDIDFADGERLFVYGLEVGWGF